ncbi:MAG: GatB/YqeY domain-containing protein [Deltaproteobacteria bacterium]|nr:GatB/YqeY domain-containing protein [Deltaproteobacteria bacterium]
MNELTKKIEADMTKAAKTQDKARLSALRMVKAALHNREIDLKEAFTEKEAIQVLSSLVKQRKDSIEQFTNGKRFDLVRKEEAELAVIQEFMPSQLTEEEVRKIIENAIGETGATGIRDMGKVMKELMPHVTGRTDGKIVSELVKARLSA